MESQLQAQSIRSAAMEKRRLAFLLQQSEVFSHFIRKSKGESALQKSPGSSSKHKSQAHPSSPRRQRRTSEEEEDEKMLREALEEGTDDAHDNIPPPVRFTASPPFVKNGTMRDYQIEGLNWMASLDYNGMSGILADEMGLGKTLQSISMMGYVQWTRPNSGPHIVVVPKSTLSNWMREIQKWCPSLRPVKLHGSKSERAETIKEHLSYGENQDSSKRTFDVLVTSYEITIIEKSALSKIPWSYLILDEAHRVKNENSRLSTVLRELSVLHRMLLTGTPLQNNLHELWALLNFLLPEIFSDSSDFDEWFDLSNSSDDDAKQEMIVQLHRLLKPFMLRRLKRTSPNQSRRRRKRYSLLACLLCKEICTRKCLKETWMR